MFGPCLSVVLPQINTCWDTETMSSVTWQLCYRENSSLTSRLSTLRDDESISQTQTWYCKCLTQNHNPERVWHTEFVPKHARGHFHFYLSVLSASFLSLQTLYGSEFLYVGVLPTVPLSTSVYIVDWRKYPIMQRMFCFLPFTLVWKILPLLTSTICH